MYCPNCGNKLNDNDKFCTKCGFNMKEEESEHKLPLGPVIVIIVAVMAIAVSGIFIFNQWQKSEKNSETVSNSKEEKQQKKDLKVENTPAATDTPVPANTPTPIPVSTPTPIPTDTPVPIQQDAPVSESAPSVENTPEQITRSNLYQQAQTEIALIEVRDAQLNSNLTYESQAEMNQDSGELYTIWDDELNVIWGYLKQSLDSASMDALTQDEINWISTKEQAMNEAEAEFAGGTMAIANRNMKGYEMTKARVYELANMLP